MKRKLSILALVMVAILFITACAGSGGSSSSGNIKMGQAYYAAHGSNAFCVATVALDGDTIVGVHLDEFQFLSDETFTGVPNSDAGLGDFFPEDRVLASKRENDGAYSALMKESGGATQNLSTSYAAIESYAVGKTISALESEINGKDEEAVVDMVASCTLVDAKGYIEAVLLAAKNA